MNPKSWVSRRRSWGVVMSLLAASLVAGAGVTSWLTAQRHEDVRASQARLRALEQQLQQERSANFSRSLRDIARSRQTRAATTSLKKGYDAYIPSHLRDMYVDLNPYRRTDPSLLVDTRDGSSYNQAHSEYHPYLNRMVDTHELTDVFLVGLGGDVLYSVKKGPAFARTLKADGSGGLSAVFQQSVGSSGEGDLVMSTGYRDTSGDPVMYAGTPVVDVTGERVAILIVQRQPWAATGLVPSQMRQSDAVNAHEAQALLALLAAAATLGLLGGFLLRGEQRRIELKQAIRHRAAEVSSLIPVPQIEHASSTRLIADKPGVDSLPLSETGSTT